VLAIVPWGLILEDFLIPNQLTLDDFCDEFTGSWMFGYVDALDAAGIRTLIVCVSSGVEVVTRRVHRPTGADICLLPVPPLYRLLRRGMRDPYGRTATATFRGPTPLQLLLLPVLFAAKELAPFVSMPTRTLSAELRRDACRVLLCQEYEFPRFDVCVTLGRLQGVAVFATFQGGDYQRWRLERIVRPFSVRRADGVIIASAAEVDRVKRRYRPRAIARIPNPVDLDTWQPYDRAPVRHELAIPDNAPLVAWHGRVEVWKKGLDTLVEAWAAVSKRHPNALLLMIGTGPDAGAVHGEIRKLGLNTIVWIDRYFHDRAKLARLLASADVYAFTSRHEGFPVAPVEAMACGLPVVASDVSGIRDVLADGEASGGVVVGPEDPEQVAAAISRLLRDDALRRDLGEAARARAEEFGLQSVGERLRTYLFGS
jgi:glycosyltransferase involved in cell wall biosynthesis